MVDPAADFSSLKGLLLNMPQQRSCTGLLQMVVDELAEQQHVALARVWLTRPGDICKTCRFRDECPTEVDCLHLVASAGRSIADPEVRWYDIHDSHYRRFPIGARKVGHIARQGEALEIRDVKSSDHSWLADRDWAEREGIDGFAGQPLVFRGSVIGVMAVFLRVPCVPGQLDWLRLIADHLAVAIVNARAFEEIEQLREQLELENEYLREEVHEAAAFGDIVGSSAALQGILRQIELVAPTDAGVLVTGESGTGKELIAREIHRRSARAKRPLIRVNCASIPRELFESEFFGHVRGAFTGAVRDRVGRFALADGGTIFLDEVGEIPMELQAKLLRVLQEGEFERVGEDRTRKTDTRVIAATNRDLKRAAEAGEFREDLYYRLNVFPVDVPPLRARPEDIPPLAAHFVTQAARKLKLPEPRLTRAVVVKLQSYDWPGNVRELQNVIERGLIASRGRTLRIDLPAGEHAAPVVQPDAGSDEPVLTESELRRREADNLRRALARTRGKVYGPDGAAELLGLRPTTLVSRLKKLSIDRRSAGRGSKVKES